MELRMCDFDGGELDVGYDNALWINRGVELAVNGQPRIGLGGAYQIDDDAVADQGLGTPVHRDEGEEPVLDLVPLAGSGRQVVDFDVDAEFIRQTLEFKFPQTRTREPLPPPPSAVMTSLVALG
jgi:hypothetical protein